MATEGTKYSDVNFSVPAGADPLGVGIPDLGKSTYDPIESIRYQTEAKTRKEMFNREMDYREYQDFMSRMPTVKGTKAEISRTLNNEVQKMGELFLEQQKAGDFAGIQKTTGGKNAQAELSRLQSKIATDVPIYNHYSDQMDKDIAVTREKGNIDRIDWELTNENMKAAEKGAKSGTVEGFARPFAENGGSLIVWKPEEADMLGWVKDSVDTFAPGVDVSIISQGMDPSGHYQTSSLETKDQTRIHDAIIKGYANAPRAVRNQIERMFASAPKAEKTAVIDGVSVPIEADEWYARKFAPKYGEKVTTKQAAVKDSDTTPSGLGGGIPRIDGEMDVEAMMEPVVMVTGSTTNATYRTNWRGKQKEVSPETTSKEELEFESYNIPLTGIDEVFDTMTPADAIDTSTGEEPDRTKIGSHKAASVSFMPTYNGEDDLPVEMEITDENGQKRTKKYIVKPGKPIPMDVQRELIKQGVALTYEPYMLTSTIYGAAQEAKAMGSVEWQEYVSKHGTTVVTPWRSITNAFLAKMGAEEYQINELKQNMAEMYGKLNRTP